MPRLIDDIRAAGRSEMPWFVQRDKQQDWTRYTRTIAEIIHDPQLPVILVDNVADYYFGAEQEHWDLGKDFPNLAPPFANCWLEHKTPRTIHSKECGDTDIAAMIPNGRVGVLLNSIDPKLATGEGIPPEARWIIWADILIDYGDRGRNVQGPHGPTFFALDEHGALIDRPWMQSYCAPEHNDFMKALITWFYPSLLAVCFLHCKNVKTVDERVDKPLAKKYHARTGQWPTQYKTLVIEPLKQILRTQGRSNEVGIQRAMHICRGHFATYGTEGHGKLFGKYTGRFWIPATVRGTKSGDKMPPREIEVKV